MKAKTDTTPYKGHFVLYLTGLIVGVAVFVIGALIAGKKDPMEWELSLFPLINGWPDSLNWFMLAVTFLGSAWMASICVATTFFIRYYRLAARLAISIFAVYGLTAIFKHIIGRARPDGLADGILGEAQFRAVEIAMGYPSTHAAIATVIMLTLVPYMRWRWRWIVPVVIAAVSISRVYLGVHLPLDVIGGVALGTAIVAFIRVLPQSLRIALRID